MTRYIQVTAILMLTFVGYVAYYYSSIYIGQSRFSEIQSRILVGMKRSQVLELAEEVKYLDHESTTESVEMEGKIINQKVDAFSYTNFMLPSLVIVRYDSKDIVLEITVDQ